MFDDPTYRAVILGAMLHDIGKLLQRGTFEQIDIRGQHPNISADFLSAFGGFFASWVAPDLLKTLVQRHQENLQHFPSALLAQDAPDPQQRALALLVNKADNLSSSQRGRTHGQYRDFKQVPLATMFWSLEAEGTTFQGLANLHGAGINGTDSLAHAFPDQFAGYPPGEYNELIQAFGPAFRGMQDRLTSGQFSDLLSHLLNLLYPYGWCVPANTQKDAPDVSLYDHLRTTCAVAACLYQRHQGRPDLAAALHEPGEDFILAAGDVSGIQSHIFAIAHVGEEIEGQGTEAAFIQGGAGFLQEVNGSGMFGCQCSISPLYGDRPLAHTNDGGQGEEGMIAWDALKQGFTKRRHWFLVGVLAAGLALGFGQAPVASGVNLTVNSTWDTPVPGDGRCTLREAIDNANGDTDTAGGDCLAGSGADSIDFSVSGTIHLLRTLPSISQDLTINGPGASSLSISGDNVQILVVDAGVTLNLEDLTVTKGYSSAGGGAIENFGTLSVTNSTFSGNRAGGDGGGIKNLGTLSVTNSTFSYNRADGYGGGGINNGSIGTLSVTNSTFFYNRADGYGGGISNEGRLSVTNSTFSGNSVTDGMGGGGISNSGTVSVTNSTFSGNRAADNPKFSGSGGGISNGGTLSVTNSTFSENSTGGGIGGGISNGGTVSVTNSTFSDNSAFWDGGGISNGSGGTVTLRNTIIANRSSVERNCYGTITDGGGNLRWPATDPSCVGSFGNPNLGSLADNGGPTHTMALLLGSAAIDAGDNAHCAANPVNNLDQRGALRPVDGDGDRSAICDIGAYERQLEGTVVIWQIGRFDGSKDEYFVGNSDYTGFKCDWLPSDSSGSQGPFVVGTTPFSAFPGEISQ